MGRILLLLLTTILLFGQSCKKDLETEDQDPQLPGDLELVDAQVIVPAGSNYPLSGHEILHQGNSLPINMDGTTRVIRANSSLSIAYLLNSDDRPVMAGFVTDSSTVISTETTAKVILFFALGIPFREDTLPHFYTNRIHEVPGFTDWVNDFTQAWKTDPQTFNNGSYTSKLRTWLEAKEEGLPAAGRVGSINVDANDVRSGLRLSPEGLGISFTNTYRRRASAFFYKMKYKLEGSNTYKPILTSIDKNTEHDQFMRIDPVSGVTSVVGEVYKNLTDRGLQSFTVTSGPAIFELQDNETEAVYRARAIGPGAIDPAKLTANELAEYQYTVTSTFVMDILFPSLGCVLGVVNQHALINDDLAATLAVDLPKIAPNFLENCFMGDYQKAFLGLLDALSSDHGFELLSKIVSASFGPDKIPVNFESQVKKGALILQCMDMALLGADFARIAIDAQLSKGLEEWDFTVRSSKVSLTPGESVVSIFAPSNKQELEAIVQNLSDEDAKKLVYEWNVRGNFGTIADTKGNSGTSFKTAEKKVTFTAKNDVGLTDGDNWETVYVKAYLDDKTIGDDTARINIKKSRYQLRPDGVTITGKQGQTNKVNLQLEPVNNGTPISPNADVDFKIIWETAGKHGGLVASGASVNSITTYNDNKTLYECVDDQVKSGSETITARIYAKNKTLPDTEYRLIDNVKAIINISNDEKRKILHVPIGCDHGDTIYNNGVSITCMIVSYASFKEDKEAKSYSIRSYNVLRPQAYSWNAGANPPAGVPSYVVQPSPGVFNISFSASWIVGGVNQVTEHFSCADAPKGMAEVIILLK